MADQVPTSRKIPPLAIIVVVILAALAAVAFGNWRTTLKTPSGGSMPQAKPDAAATMPVQPSISNTAAGASDEKGAVGHGHSEDTTGGAR